MAVNEDTFVPVGSQVGHRIGVVNPRRKRCRRLHPLPTLPPLIRTQSGTAVHVVDVPGHERVRFLARDFLPNVGAVVFVVDATERSKAEIGACAAYLYDVLSGPEVRSVNPDVLVVCNKGDIVTAAAPAYVRGKLEEEMYAPSWPRCCALGWGVW